MAESGIAQLQLLETSRELSIIRLTNNIAEDDNDASQKRVSDASLAPGGYDEETSPTSLAADLVHYKELFSKLRFSYIEQVTKEKFLRAITSETPLFIEPHENVQLEAQLAKEKVALKAQKEEVRKLIEELDARGRDLAMRHESIQLQKTTLLELPQILAELENAVESLRTEYPSPAKSDNPNLNLPLAGTLSLLSDRQNELAALNAQISQLQSALPQKTKELERLEAELQPLQNQKKAAVARAKEARTRKEQGGIDELEQKGRWYRAADTVMQEMLDLPA